MISWNTFCFYNSDTKVAFEGMCRLLFKHKYLCADAHLISAPNNPGIEVEPVWDREQAHRVSFQSKFFDNGTDYDQILHSAKETVKYYCGKLDRIYLYCNKNITPSAKRYIEIVTLLRDNGIELVPVCGDAVIDQVRDDQQVEHIYFQGLQITANWVSKQLSKSLAALGERYNHQFNIETDTQRRFDLFMCNESACNILNQKKKEAISNLEHYANAYGEGRSLARKFLHSLYKIEDINKQSLCVAGTWYDTLLRDHADDIEAARKRVADYTRIAEEKGAMKEAWPSIADKNSKTFLQLLMIYKFPQPMCN